MLVCIYYSRNLLSTAYALSQSLKKNHMTKEVQCSDTLPKMLSSWKTVELRIELGLSDVFIIKYKSDVFITKKLAACRRNRH